MLMAVSMKPAVILMSSSIILREVRAGVPGGGGVGGP